MTSSAMFGPDDELAELVTGFIAGRLKATPLGGRRAPATATTGETGNTGTTTGASITEAGLGAAAAWARFTRDVLPANLGLASERFLAFIPAAPTTAAVWMDAVVGAASFSAESSLEAAGAVAAENETLDFLRALTGMPAGAGGCFMSGGSIGNLSALAVARDHTVDRGAVAIADSAHASVVNALHLLGAAPLVVPTGGDGRMTARATRRALAGSHQVTTIVASAGSTNAGVMDDLAGLAELAAELGAWFHVDAAYGGAALLLPERRHLFTGIECADSVIIDPHKWMLAPLGSCALLYRDPARAATVHTQRGPYLEALHDAGEQGSARSGWNPADYGFQLTRRAAGLPLWFSLAVHGVAAHRAAVGRAVHLATELADALERSAVAEPVMRPDLGVVLFRRAGWGAHEWRSWADRVLGAGIAFVVPTTWRGEPVGRVVFLHPATPDSIIDELVDSLA